MADPGLPRGGVPNFPKNCMKLKDAKMLKMQVHCGISIVLKMREHCGISIVQKM